VIALRQFLIVGLLLSLSACASERQLARDTWPFGNPNEPVVTSENGMRAVGQVAVVAPIAPQAGDVWPGPVEPVPTLSQMEQNMNTPLGQKFTPSLPSPYPPGQAPADDSPSTAPPLPLPNATSPITPAPLPGVSPQGVNGSFGAPMPSAPPISTLTPQGATSPPSSHAP
jgi:hypothetical protein